VSFWQGFVLSVGALLELSGLGVAGFGLTRTWRQHAPNASLIRAIRAEIVGELKRMVRRPPAVTGVMAVSELSVDMSASGHVAKSFTMGATVEQRIEQLKHEVDEASAQAAKANHLVEDLRHDLTKTTDALRADIDNLSGDVKERVRSEALDGLPLAVFGLGLAVLGAAFQWWSAVL
jgi:hypothetical protein